jgi:formylglycine-generating enzyme required for sulfatase activity
MRFLPIEPGVFQMGSAEYQSKLCCYTEKVHKVELTHPFLMGETEVTQAQWEQVTGKRPSKDKKCGPECPVENITWLDAVNFANALSAREGLRPAYLVQRKRVRWDKTSDGYRLPTEAEWEFAAKAGQNTKYIGSDKVSLVSWSRSKPSSDEVMDDLRKNGLEYSSKRVHNAYHKHPVAKLQPNAWGMFDMGGNVYEWCWDWFARYSGDAVDPSGPMDGEERVQRGGFYRGDRVRIRAAWRDSSPPKKRFGGVGVRLVRNMPTEDL